MGIGDWGLGPIPSPQSPIPNPHYSEFYYRSCFEIMEIIHYYIIYYKNVFKANKGDIIGR